MGLFDKFKNNGGFMDQIRCDEPSYLIWKWHPAGSEARNNTRENAVRWGSSLRVKDGEVAVFVYNQKDGPMQDFIVGPFDETIKTANFPVLASIVGLAYDSGTLFQAEIYFINLARIIQIRFGVPYFDVFDPRFSDFGVPMAVRGTLSFSISDYREFIKLHRLQEFDLQDFEEQVKDAVIRYVKNTVANIPAEHNIPVLQIEKKTEEITSIAEEEITARLAENFGVTVSGLDIGTIEIDKTSDGYAQLKSVTIDVAGATVQAQTAANIKDIQDKQRIHAENLEETLRIQREEAQYAQRKQTQSANFAAYQLEKQAEVGVAGANALGQMGANGGGSVDLGGGGGFNPAAMMAGMAMGGAVGQNMAGMMNGMMGGMNTAPVAPPPLPQTAYHVAVNGQAQGPFQMNVLQQMVQNGTLTQTTLVWNSTMTAWTAAGAVAELQALFNANPTPPPIPNT